MNKKHTGGADANGNSERKMHDIDASQFAIFVRRQQYRQLTRHAALTRADEKHKLTVQAKNSMQQRVSFAELVQCACFPLAKTSKQLMLVIVKSVSLYAQYEWILKRMSIAASVEQVAASTSQRIMFRTTDKFDLQIKPDKSNNTHVLVLLSLKQLQNANSAYSQGIFLHCIQGDLFKVIHFEHVLDGQAQIVITQESAVYDLITSLNTKLYLC